MFLKTLPALALLAAAPSLAAVTPGTTAPFTFNLSAGSNSSNTYGNIRGFSATTQGTTIGLTATGWMARQNSAGNYVVEKAYLGQYGGSGLGVTNTSEGNGANNTHQIDNASGVDFVLLQFDQQVTLTGFTRNTFGLPGGFDNDAFASAFSIPNVGLTALNLTGLTFGGSNLPATIAGNGAPGATVSGIGPANVWAIGAAFGTGMPDGFKLNTLVTNFAAPPLPPPPPSAVPEPSTWAMLILGFGMVGGAVRRRKGVAAVAA